MIIDAYTIDLLVIGVLVALCGLSARHRASVWRIGSDGAGYHGISAPAVDRSRRAHEGGTKQGVARLPPAVGGAHGRAQAKTLGQRTRVGAIVGRADPYQ